MKKCLTRACSETLQPHEITVGVGFLYLEKSKNKMAAELKVKFITPHPQFDCCRKSNEKSGHDIAIVELAADVPAEMSRRMVTKAAKVAPMGSLRGLGIKVLSVAGWGQ
uniref:Uncharacterized protein n=1 Tax=Romanomermis culicivorax TaxID=13658 RepID=A0A915IAV2_ROMCU